MSSFVYDKSFSLNDEIFSLAFSIFTMRYLGVDFFLFVITGYYWAPWICRLVFFTSWEIFKHCFFQYYFFFLLSSQYFHYIYVHVLKGVAHFPEVLFHFLHSIFSLFFELHNAYWSIFKSTGSFASSNLLFEPL